MSLDEPIAMARRWYDEVWNQRNADTLQELFARDGAVHGGDGITRAADGFAEFRRDLLSALPDFHVRVDNAIAGNGMVAVLWTATGTHTAEGLHGIPPSQSPIDVSGLTLLRVRDGQFVEIWDRYNHTAVMAKLRPRPEIRIEA